jgi:alkylresorcinol/alkylpyrone synthase
LRAGEALLASGRCRRVLSVCVEVCSAAFYLDDDPGVLISACLFGDAAGAAVLSPEPKPGGRAVKWTSSHSVISAKDRDLLRFEHANGMLRNVLSPQVPALAARYSSEVLGTALSAAGVAQEQITGWIWHAGGRDVLLALQERFWLSAEDVRHSAGVLREYGNISSSCVYFVLQAALAEGAPGGWWWLSSFGAGFSCHGALLKVE